MKYETIAQLGPDGTLALSVPFGREGANKTVHVVIETVEAGTPRSKMTPEDWQKFVQSIAGKISDPTFVRHPQGELEERNPLS
jgi:hypothetical protein